MLWIKKCYVRTGVRTDERTEVNTQCLWPLRGGGIINKEKMFLFEARVLFSSQRSVTNAVHFQMKFPVVVEPVVTEEESTTLYLFCI